MAKITELSRGFRFHQNREPERCMYPGEFVALLWEHKHPRLTSIGVETNRFGARIRKDVGVIASGTVWVADEHEKMMFELIPCDCLPYTTIKDASFNPDKNKFEGETARSWRRMLLDLCKGGCLCPSLELSYLLGLDTTELTPKELRV